jgi:hypothetical protein
MSDNQPARCYLEIELHLEHLVSEEELTQLGEDILSLSKQYKAYPPKVRVVRNPVYDSFGNLFE